MTKKYIVLILIFNFCYSQQKIDVNYIAEYSLNFKEYENRKPEYLKNTFILLMNDKESFFKNVSVYVKDSLVKAGKIRETGDIQKDLPVFGKYVPEFPYTVYRKGSQTTFANHINFSGEFRYSETVNFAWKITKEAKKINGVVCNKATTKKWGRNWTAYYSPKHPLPFGPYKFYGLPGLIFEVYDDAKDYTFTLYYHKKRKVTNFTLFNYPKAKTVSKKQYEILRHNAAIKPFEGTSVEGYPDMERKINKQRIEDEKNYNPIELKE